MTDSAGQAARSQRRARTVAWVLLVLASTLMISYGVVSGGWSLWLPSPSFQQAIWAGNRYVYAGCALSLASAVWSHIRGNPLWVTVCVGLPGVLVGWATWDDYYGFVRYLAAVVSFPLALAGVAEVLWARGYRQR